MTAIFCICGGPDKAESRYRWAFAIMENTCHERVFPGSGRMPTRSLRMFIVGLPEIQQKEVECRAATWAFPGS
jgi:hypothetical protein